MPKRRDEIKVIFFAGHDVTNVNAPPDKSYKEHTFNHRTCIYLYKLLKQQGFGTVTFGNPSGGSMSLANRCSMANQGKYDLAVFIHYDSMGWTWSKRRGVHVFHHPQAPKQGGAKLAKDIYNKLIGGTIMPHLGIKTANFQVLRQTVMPSCLAECGFMSNKEDAALMKSEDYQKECAREIAMGMGVFLGHEIKFPEPKKEKMDYKEIIESLTKWSDVYLADIEKMHRDNVNWKHFIEKIYYHGW